VSDGDEFDPATFLVEDYKLKAGYLVQHLSRMWTRFGLFVTLQSGLVAVLLFEGRLSDSAPYVAIVQAVLSLLWLSMGRHDRHLIRLYKHQVKQSLERLEKDAGVPAGIVPVADVTCTNAKLPQTAGLARLLEARGAADVPRFPALIPAILLVFWLVMIDALFDGWPFG
jgi:hypothetical protein